MPAPKTSYYRIGSQKDRPVTPTDLTPAQLQDALLSSGVRLVAYGDGEHHSIEVKRQFNEVVEHVKKPPKTVMLEWPSQDQTVVDAYLSTDGGEKELKALEALKRKVTPESSAYAPKRDPQARLDYFRQASRHYTLPKSKGIKIALVDDRNLDKKGAAIDLHNEELEVEKRYSIVAEMIGKGVAKAERGKLTVGGLLDKKEEELRKIAKEVQELVAESYVYPTDKELDEALQDVSAERKSRLLKDNDIIARMSKDELKDYIKSYVESLPPPKTGKKTYTDYTYDDLREMAKAKLSAVREKKQAAENVRDAERDEKMAGNVLTALGKDGNGMMMIGLGHYGKKDKGRTEPNLEDRLRKELGDKFARVDIIPISQDALDIISGKDGLKQLVAIGGEEGADYTIFVADERVPYSMGTSTVRPVEVDKGPHKDLAERVTKWEQAAKKADVKKEEKKEENKEEKKESKKGDTPVGGALPDLKSVGVRDDTAGDDDKALSDALRFAKAAKGRGEPFEIT